MQEKISGSPRFSVLQATKSWAGPRNEASLGSCYHPNCIDTLIQQVLKLSNA